MDRSTLTGALLLFLFYGVCYIAVIFVLIWMMVFGYREMIRSIDWMMSTTEFECNVMSVEPACHRDGYNISVEVTNGSKCGTLNRNICPYYDKVIENTTIPCYVDDDCNFDINKPTVDVFGTSAAVVLTVVFCSCLCLIVYYCKQRTQAERQQRRERERRLRESSINLISLDNTEMPGKYQNA
eukprot:TRINITY_DN4356_c0_g3_i1.p1 TRINITY_DN4356_c0_g3~~TRINITY_DN4356_c0_g3_i1.p1  ORF type:complete len:183 (+),score=26.04 TRINITY_DN4356_c0_g3_i1:44-592(+)